MVNKMPKLLHCFLGSWHHSHTANLITSILGSFMTWMQGHSKHFYADMECSFATFRGPHAHDNIQNVVLSSLQIIHLQRWSGTGAGLEPVQSCCPTTASTTSPPLLQHGYSHNRYSVQCHVCKGAQVHTNLCRQRLPSPCSHYCKHLVLYPPFYSNKVSSHIPCYQTPSHFIYEITAKTKRLL